MCVRSWGKLFFIIFQMTAFRARRYINSFRKEATPCFKTKKKEWIFIARTVASRFQGGETHVKFVFLCLNCPVTDRCCEILCGCAHINGRLYLPGGLLKRLIRCAWQVGTNVRSVLQLYSFMFCSQHSFTVSTFLLHTFPFVYSLAPGDFRGNNIFFFHNGSWL